LRFTVTRAKSSDVDAIVAVQAAAWLATYPSATHGVTAADVQLRLAGASGERTAWRVARLRAALASPSDRDVYHVARTSDAVIGYGHARVDAAGVHRLSALYVHPAAQGVGVGFALAQRALDRHGDHPVHVVVVTYNRRAVEFYERLGFRVTGPIEDLNGRASGFVELPLVELVRPRNRAVVDPDRPGDTCDV
jgi:GNAT superfamily N-acetyltransferase